MSSSHSVYFLKCPITNVVKYIGITNNSSRRKLEHTAHMCDYYNPHMKAWKNKLKLLGLRPIFYEFISGITKEQACELEIKLISLFKEFTHVNLINLTIGGEYSGISENHISNRLRGKTEIEIYGAEKAKQRSQQKSKSAAGTGNPNYGGKNCTPEWREHQITSQSKKPLFVYLRDGTFIGKFRNSKECAKALNVKDRKVRNYKDKNWAIGRKFLIKSKQL